MPRWILAAICATAASAATATMVLAIPAGAASRSPARPTPAPARHAVRLTLAETCASLPHGIADGSTSLTWWSAQQGSDDAGTIYWTIRCQGANPQQPQDFFIPYVDGGNDSLPVPAGVELRTGSLGVIPVR